MFTKKMIAAAAALLATQVAFADDKLIDSVSVDVGAGENVQMIRLNATKATAETVNADFKTLAASPFPAK